MLDGSLPGQRLPHDVAAERLLLGAVLLAGPENPKPIDDALRIGLMAADFVLAENAAVYRAMADLRQAGRVIDFATLTHALGDCQALAHVDGAPEYLSKLFSGAVVISTAAEHASIIKVCAHRREIIAAADSARDGGDLDAIRAAIVKSTITTSNARRKPISPVDWQGREPPPREWIVADYIPANRITGLMGPGGIGKSLAAQQLQTARAIGRPWLGLFTAKGRSTGVYAEDEDHELWRRQEAINRQYGCDMRDIDKMQMLSVVDEDHVIASVGRDNELALRPFYFEVVRCAHDHRSGLLILDNASCLFVCDQNSEVHAKLIVNQVCGRMAREIGCTVVLLRHPSRAGISSDDGDSGSVAWSNAFRSRLYLSKPSKDGADKPDKNARILRRQKGNYNATDDDDDAVRLMWRDGCLYPESTSGGVFGSIERRTAERAFVEGLAEARAAGRELTDANCTSVYAPKVIARTNPGNGFKVRDLERAMHTLFAAGSIRMEPFGPPSKGKRRMVLCNGIGEQQ